MLFQGLPQRWWSVCLPAIVLSTLLAGCSMPGRDSSSPGPLARLWPWTKKTTRYEPPVEIVEHQEVKDPLALKLRYAKWMEEVENYKTARKNYNLVLEERPKDIEAIVGLARIDQTEGKLATAEAGFKKALSLQPDSPAAKNGLGQLYASQGRLRDALPLLNEAVLADPANEHYRYQLAVVLARSGDTSAALPHFVESVGEATAHYNVGMVLMSQGRTRQAEQHFAQALQHNPEFEQAQQAIAQLRRQRPSGGTYASRAPASRAPASRTSASRTPATHTPTAGIRAAGHSRPATSPVPQR